MAHTHTHTPSESQILSAYVSSIFKLVRCSSTPSRRTPVLARSQSFNNFLPVRPETRLGISVIQFSFVPFATLGKFLSLTNVTYVQNICRLSQLPLSRPVPPATRSLSLSLSLACISCCYNAKHLYGRDVPSSRQRLHFTSLGMWQLLFCGSLSSLLPFALCCPLNL